MIKDIFRTGRPKYNGIYRGVVADNEDPKYMARVRIRIYGIMYKADIPTNALPWAVPASSISAGAGHSGSNGWGTIAIPRVDSKVWVFFENGNPLSPVYFAEANDGIDGRLPNILPVEGDDKNYPNRMGFRLPNGIDVYFDMEDDVMKITHPSGTYITIDTNGNVTIDSIKNITITAAENVTINAGEDTTVNTKNATVNADEDVDVIAGGDVSIQGDNITIEGSSVDINP